MVRELPLMTFGTGDCINMIASPVAAWFLTVRDDAATGMTMPAHPRNEAASSVLII